MKPLPVSLVLLLLALCRPSSAELEIDEAKAKELFLKLDALYKFVPTAQETSMESKAVEYADLFILTAMKLTGTGTSILEAGTLKALNNGLDCAFKGAVMFETEFRTAFYGTGGADATRTEDEKTQAKNDGMDCGTTPSGAAPNEWDCYCTAKNPYVYCAAQRDHPAGTPTGDCPKDALDKLKLEGKKELAKVYDYKKIIDEIKDKNAEIKGVVGAATEGSIVTYAKKPKQLDVFCDADDSKVEDAVKPLMASSALYAAMDGVTAALALGGDGFAKLKAACDSNDQELMKEEFGKCYCAKDKGFTFCFLKAIAKELKKAGSLTGCEGATPAIDESKAPAKVVIGAPSKGSSDKPGTPGNPTPAPASEATTSSLLMVPLAAAAVMLARV